MHVVFKPDPSANSQFVVFAAGEHLTKGTLVSLIHPATMAILFGSTLWTGFLGWQWRRTRTIPDELKALKKEQAPAGEDGKRPVSPVDARIAELEEVSCSQLLTTMLLFICMEDLGPLLHLQEALHQTDRYRKCFD